MTRMAIHIRKWLLLPRVWRFVGVASTAVGLLCFALSSSFNRLFGKWNMFKFFLYSVTSFILCLLIFFAKVWRHSVGHRFKANMAFSVLTITAVYSFVYDRLVSGKPDAYGLISNCAFAIMSFSLSRQTHLGVEVDLLHFFLGCVTVELMKIKLILVIVGACFSYSLIHLRSILDSPSENGHLELQDPQHIVIHVGSRQANTDVILSTPEADTHVPLSTPQQVDTHVSLSTPLQGGTHGDLGTPLLADTHGDLSTPQEDSELWRTIIDGFEFQNEEIASKLQKQLALYLNGTRDQIPLELTDSHNFSIYHLQLPRGKYLHEIVKRMITTRLEKVCLDEYSKCRRNFLTICLEKFGLSTSSISIDVDEKTIMSWIKASNVVFKVLLPNERRLCHRVFLPFSSTADLAFMEVCRDLTQQLLDLANEFSGDTDSVKYLGNILKVYDIIQVLNLDFMKLFPDQCSVSLQNEAFQTSLRLEEAITGIFDKVENLIRSDTGGTDVNGGICPIIEEVMNHICACRNEKASWIIDRIIKTMKLLKSHLKAKSKTFTDLALRHIFKMNNLQLIEKKAKEYELETILEVNWIQQKIARVRQKLKLYCESSCDQVLGYLKLDNNVELHVTAESLIEKLVAFNTFFREIWEVQHTWVITDENLKQEIIKSMEDLLLLPYGIFLGKFQTIVDKDSDKYIWYSIFDLQDLIKYMFNGRVTEASNLKDKDRS